MLLRMSLRLLNHTNESLILRSWVPQGTKRLEGWPQAQYYSIGATMVGCLNWLASSFLLIMPVSV